jgi:hypothetical protein
MGAGPHVTKNEITIIKKLLSQNLTVNEIAILTKRSTHTIRGVKNGKYDEQEKPKPNVIQPMTREESDRAVYPEPEEKESEVITKLEKIRMSEVQTNYLLDLMIKKFDELLGMLK